MTNKTTKLMTGSKNRQRVCEDTNQEEESTNQNSGNEEKVPEALGMWDQNETYAQGDSFFNDSDHYFLKPRGIETW